MRSYLQHGRRHGPNGSDPIDFADHVIWPTEPVVLPLGSAAGPLIVAGGSVTIDSNRKNNIKAVLPSGSCSLYWRMACGPGSYTLYVVSALGSTNGTMTAKIAGAYDLATVAPAPGDWLTLGTYDFHNSVTVVYNELRVPGLHIGNQISGITPEWFIPNDGNEGVSELYTLSTSVSAGGLVNGGSGYYFLRLDLTGYFELSEVVVTRDTANF